MRGTTVIEILDSQGKFDELFVGVKLERVGRWSNVRRCVLQVKSCTSRDAIVG